MLMPLVNGLQVTVKGAETYFSSGTIDLGSSLNPCMYTIAFCIDYARGEWEGYLEVVLCYCLFFTAAPLPEACHARLGAARTRIEST